MTESTATATADLWQQLVSSYQTYSQFAAKLLADSENRVKVLGPALRGKDWRIALALIGSLTPEERLQLFSEWVRLASWGHGAVQVARNMILSLPHDWVMSRIEAEAEPYLREGDYDNYRRFLELFDLLDRDLTLRLARRAASNQDPDIREAGEDFLAKLNGQS